MANMKQEAMLTLYSSYRGDDQLLLLFVDLLLWLLLCRYYY